MEDNKPPPFKRPSIDLGSPKRKWKTVCGSLLSVGDTVPDVGRLKEVVTGSDGVTVLGAGGVIKYFRFIDDVLAFVVEE